MDFCDSAVEQAMSLGFGLVTFDSPPSHQVEPGAILSTYHALAYYYVLKPTVSFWEVQ